MVRFVCVALGGVCDSALLPSHGDWASLVSAHVDRHVSHLFDAQSAAVVCGEIDIKNDNEGPRRWIVSSIDDTHFRGAECRGTGPGVC